MSRPAIFISYASPDLEFASAVVESLKAAGEACWIAPSQITGAENYAEEITSAIRSCSFVIVLLSESSNRSRHVALELNEAVSCQKLILPIRLDTCELTPTLRYFLGMSQWIDATVAPFSGHLPKVLETVRDLAAGGAAWQTRAGAGRNTPYDLLKAIRIALKLGHTMKQVEIQLDIPIAELSADDLKRRTEYLSVIRELAEKLGIARVLTFKVEKDGSVTDFGKNGFLLRNALEAKFGRRASQALELSYMTLRSIEHTIRFEMGPEQSLERLERLVAALDLSPLHISKLRSQLTADIQGGKPFFDFLDDCCLDVDDQALFLRPHCLYRCNLWQTVCLISLAALGNAENATEAAGRLRIQAQVFADELDVVLPPFEVYPGDPFATSEEHQAGLRATALHFLLDGVLSRLGRKAMEDGGPRFGALAELGVKSSLMLLLYSQKDEAKLSSPLEDAVTSAFRLSAIPEDISREFLAAIRNRASYRRVRATLLQMHDSIGNYLYSLLDRAQ